MGLILWQEAAKLAPFLLSQYNFWKFGITHGTFNITLPNWRVKVRNKIGMNVLFRDSFPSLQKKTNLKIFIFTPSFSKQCFPIFALMFYVLAHQNALHTTTTGDMQPRRILFGLASCCLGDYLLTSKETFLQGVGAFALGHIFYIR